MGNDIKYLDAMKKIISMRTKLDSLDKQFIDTYNLDVDYISRLKGIIFSKENNLDIVLSADQMSEILGETSIILTKKDADMANLLNVLKQMNDDLEDLIIETYNFLESIDNL